MTPLPAYWQGSQAKGRPLVLLHGFLGSGTDWQSLSAELAPIPCLAPDLPGHGQNPLQACSFAAMASQFWQDLEDAGIQEIDLLGYSMGARLALYLLLAAPEKIRTCILESGSPGLSDPNARKQRQASDQALAHRLESESLADFLQDWYEQPLFANLKQSSGFAEMFRRRLQNNPLGLARSLREAGTGVAPDLWGRLPEIQRPVLYLAGQSDAKFCLMGQQMAKVCPTLQLQILPGGHCLHQENPLGWLKSVKAFLKSAHQPTV